MPPTFASAARAPAPRAGAAARPSAPLPVVGPWRLVRRIGGGRWTCVYQARPLDSPDGWPADYAVKLVPPESEDDSDAVLHLAHEARAAERANHPNLSAVLDAHTNSPPYYLVMPLLPGRTVAAMLNDGPPPIPQCLWIARQSAQALAAFHAAGWWHGDVKPANMIVSPQGHATLIDLGFARPAAISASLGDPFLGSPAYAAPELFCPAMRIDGRADVYSLGICLYEMLTGNPPFRHQAVPDLVESHLRHTPPEPRRFGGRLHPAITRLVRTTLAKQPLRRPAAAELAERLMRLEIETFEDR